MVATETLIPQTAATVHPYLGLYLTMLTALVVIALALRFVPSNSSQMIVNYNYGACPTFDQSSSAYNAMTSALFIAHIYLLI